MESTRQLGTKRADMIDRFAGMLIGAFGLHAPAVIDDQIQSANTTNPLAEDTWRLLASAVARQLDRGGR